MKAIILAGGGGTRLWPVSRQGEPKQIKPFLDNDTLLQKTYKRARLIFEPQDIYISTNIKFKNLIKEQLPEVENTQYILEPERKDTAAAIGLAAARIYKDYPEESIITLNSDHYVKKEDEFANIVRFCEEIVSDNPDKTVLLGINPSYPETGYGYIKMASLFKENGLNKVFRVEKFVEKPDAETAKKYLQKWEYLWNPAYFCWNVSHLLGLFKKYLPEMYQILMNCFDENNNVKAEEFSKIDPISIDYGIMEKLGSEEMLVVPADFGWADIGNWKSIKDVLSSRDEENLIKGEHVDVGSKGSLIYSLSGKLVATIGLEDFIIIDTPDTLLVCPKDKAGEVKKIVEKLKEKGMDQYL